MSSGDDNPLWRTITRIGIVIGIVAALVTIVGALRLASTPATKRDPTATTQASLHATATTPATSAPPTTVAPTPTPTPTPIPLPPPTPTLAPQVKTILVEAVTAVPGADSGLTVKFGAAIQIQASGRALYGYAADCGAVTHPYTDPDGQRFSTDTSSSPACPILYENDSTLPSAPIGSLLARVGPSGAWFEVGSRYSGVAPDSGEVFLIYNDGTGGYADNSGNYVVTVTVQA